MFAIIKTGAKQYKVTQGMALKVEKINSNVGDVVEFNEVLMVSDGQKTAWGAPFVQYAKVTGEIMKHDRDKKVLVFKLKPRKDHRKLNGHRQYYSLVRINQIVLEEQHGA